MSNEPPAERPPTAREKRELETLVRGIVRAQGNVFIKRLLRKLQITVGATKEEFEGSLLQAIQDGQLRRHHIDEWLEEIEGWGKQYVLLYRVPLGLAQDPIWTAPGRIQQKAEKAGLGSAWNAESSLKFPEERTLTGIYFKDESLRVTWHQALSDWVRENARDYQQTIDDELYEFRAHRQSADRSVMRFELRLQDKLAAVFLQEPWGKETRDKALKEVKGVVSKFFDFSLLESDPFRVSRAIKKIDQAALEKKQNESQNVRTHSTRLSSFGASVEFSSATKDVGYQDIEPLRHVRRALRPEKFQGEHGAFLFKRTGPRGSVRELRIDLYGAEQRIRVWAQMTAIEVWEILRVLKHYG
jgi:hypothetical protein